MSVQFARMSPIGSELPAYERTVERHGGIWKRIAGSCTDVCGANRTPVPPHARYSELLAYRPEVADGMELVKHDWAQCQ